VKRRREHIINSFNGKERKNGVYWGHTYPVEVQKGRRTSFFRQKYSIYKISRL